MTRATLAISLFCLAFAIPAVAEDDPAFVGQWVLNAELSEEKQPKKKSGGGSGFRPSVSIGGIYVPVPGGGDSGGGTPIKTPDAVYAKQITIARLDAKTVVVKYHKLGVDTYVAGNVQGTKTRWSDDKLTSSYKATSASVNESFEVEDDGRLHITIKVNPKSGSTRTFKRVFERAADRAEAAAQPPS